MATVNFTKAQATAIPHVDDDKCEACRRCLARAVCKSKAILQLDPGESPFIDSSRCYACYVCIPACPNGAIVRNGHE
jgi:MinD superfamily P-loop ATPase